jgi:hypothetical protein
MLAISSQSTIYVQVPVYNTEGIDPTSDKVEFAFIGPFGTTPQAGDAPPTPETVWTQGTWDAGTPYTCRLLVGPDAGQITLTVGSYQVWVRITDAPERPVLWSGPLVVT